MIFYFILYLYKSVGCDLSQWM